MLKTIFLPTTVKSYYLFSTRIVGLEINKTHISGCLTKKMGYSTTLEQLFTEPIEQGPFATWTERTVQALKKLSDNIKPSDTIYSVLPSSVVVFKEIQLPFTTHEKIQLVLNFEIEPLLPFALSDAIIDFVITHQTTTESTVLVVAVQKKHIDEHINLFKAADLPIPIITVDFLVLYNVYLQNSFYPTLNSRVVLTDFGSSAMRMGYIDNGQLKQIRNLPQAGLSAIAKALADKLQISGAQAMEQLLRFGLTNNDNPTYLQEVLAIFAGINKSIMLTLNSFSSQEKDPTAAKHMLLLMGQGARIPDIDTLISKETGYQTVIVDPVKFLEPIDLGNYKNSPLLPGSITCISATLSSGVIEEFNLCKEGFEQSDERTFIIQLASFGILLTTFILLLCGHAFIQIRALKREARQSSAQAIEALQKNFPDAIEADQTDIAEAVQQAREAIEELKKKWSKFSDEQRISPLKYLLEMTSAINKEATDLKIDAITINDNTITLQGQVRDHDALKMLEQEINNIPLFKVAQPGPADPIFQMKIHIRSGTEAKK